MRRASSPPPSERDAECADLAAALCRSEPGAATRLVAAFARDLAGWVAARTGRGAAFGEEMAQEALVRAVRRPRMAASHAELLARLRRMALHAAVDRIRAEQARERTLRALAERPDAAGGGRPAAGEGAAADPRERLEREALLMQLREEISRLDGESQAILRLRFGLGAPVAAVAALLEAAPDAVESRLRRVLAALRGRMGGDA